MGVDMSETIAQRAERTARAMDKFGFPTTASTLRALAAANAQLERERDALRKEWREIAAGLTTDEPEIGELWPMVSEVSGSLTAVRQYFKNEITEHNTTKAQRDAATSALAKAEGERDSMPRYRHVKRGTIYEIVLRCCLQLDGEHDMSPMVVYRDVADGSLWTRRQSEFFDGRFEALTPAPEAPNAAVREAGSALWTEDHRQKMAQEASAILDEMRQGAPKDGE